MKKERAYPWLLLVLGAILLFAGNQDLLVTSPFFIIGNCSFPLSYLA